MAVGNPGMVEIHLRAARHADPLHHAGRSAVVGNGEGENCGDILFLEREIEERPASFRHITIAPEAGGKAPADLHSLRRKDFRHAGERQAAESRSEEHTSELQSLMRISYAVFCLKKKKQ